MRSSTGVAALVLLAGTVAGSEPSLAQAHEVQRLVSDSWMPGYLNEEGKYVKDVYAPIGTSLAEGGQVLVREESDSPRPGFMREDNGGPYVRYRLQRIVPAPLR